MTTLKTAVSADEFLRMRLEPGHRWELVEGEVIQLSPAGSFHGKTAHQAGWILGSFVKTGNLGLVFATETGFQLASDPDTVRAPDAAFVRRDRIPASGPPEGFWKLAPDLVVEVVSPGDTAPEVEENISAWLEAGVRMALVLYPRTRTIHLHRPAADVRVLKANNPVEGGDVLPGFSCPAREFFE